MAFLDNNPFANGFQELAPLRMPPVVPLRPPPVVPLRSPPVVPPSGEPIIVRPADEPFHLTAATGNKNLT